MFRVIACMCTLCCVSSTLLGQTITLYDLELLGDLGTPGNVRVERISDNGLYVTGRAMNVNGKNRAYRWDATNGMVNLGVVGNDSTSHGLGVNDFGFVAGFSQGSLKRSVVWDDLFQKILIGAYGDPDQANDISDFISTCGSYTLSGQTHGYVDSPFLGFQDLGSFSIGGGVQSVGYAINNLEQIAGWADDINGNIRPMFWSNGIMWNLGTLSSDPSVYGRAYDINGNGISVGYETNNALGEVRAFFGSGSTHIVELPRGDFDTYEHIRAYGINDVPQIAGSAFDVFVQGSNTALLWNGLNKDPIDLEEWTIFPPSIVGTLRDAIDVSNDGIVVGHGEFNGVYGGYRLIPRQVSLDLSLPDPGLAGQDNTITVTGVTPNEDVTFVFGRTPGSQTVPGCTITVDMQDPQVIEVVSESNFEASTTMFVPQGVSGQTFYMQAIEEQTCRKSNLVTYIFP